MVRTARFHSALDLAVLAFVAIVPVACADPDPVQGGSLRVGLWGEGASGTDYRLVDAGFRITATGVDAIVSAEDEPDGTAALRVPLAAGDYELELEPGWAVYRGNIGDPEPVRVEADLVTDNPVAFSVADNLATEVTYVFEIEGDVVPMTDGTLDVDVEFQEDDGMCTFGPQEWLLDVGDGQSPVGQGGGWQSFTAPRDSFLAFIPMMWEAGASEDPFTLNVYAGVGTSGALLSTGLYGAPQLEAAQFVWFGIIPFEIAAGQSYTIEGVDAQGWRTESGAVPGATSSAGNTFHKTMQLHGFACD